MPHPRFWLPFVMVGAIGFSTAFAGPDRTEPISVGDKVTINFNLMVPETHFAIKDNVSQYVPGDHQLVPGLERELMGMKAGEQKHVELTPEEGFGTYDRDKRMTVARNRVPEDAKVGDVYKTEHGQPFMIQELSDQQAVVDFNHPLAGKRIIFDVQVLKVERQAGDAQSSSSSNVQEPAGHEEATITTLTGATIEHVDQDTQKLGVRTQQGENWSLEVTNHDVLKDLHAGDRVSLELNSDDRVKNVVKTEGAK
ncbi:MAG TPA: FKBP-type peptidyl-prolyl cis-trans isomerase [Nitrospiraceae bacterium]|nr:FKBP-type peptidyl-prolyl cis-trans isomerase [Nitrospiraceae bacterium]